MKPLPQRAMAWAAAALACLCALGAYGFRERAAVPAVSGPARPAAYIGRLQTEVAALQGLLYQQAVAPQEAASEYMDGLERSLAEGARWLTDSGMGDAARALEAYLRAAREVRDAAAREDGPIRGAGYEEAGRLLAGPVHAAAGEALRALAAAQEGLPDPLPALARRIGAEAEAGARLLLGAALGLGLIALVGLVAPPPVRAAEPGVEAAAKGAAEAAEAEEAEAAAEPPFPPPEELALLTRTGREAGSGAAELAEGLDQVRTAQGEAAANLAALRGSIIRAQEALEQAAAGLQEEESHRLGRVEALRDGHADASGQAGEVAVRADALARAVAGAAEQVGQARERLEALLSRSERAAASLDELTERTRHIDGVVAAIQSIATRTHMLALNAAIEAARAGERGRGFAVVAGSVRELASQAQRHAKEIEERVSGIAELARSGADEARQHRSLTEEAARSVREAEERAASLAQTAQQSAAEARRLHEALAALQRQAEEAVHPVAAGTAESGPETERSLAEAARAAEEALFRSAADAMALGEAVQISAALQERLEALTRTLVGWKKQVGR